MKKLSTFLTICLFFFVSNCFAALPVTDNYFRAWDSNSKLLSGGCLYTYEPGTTTKVTTYSNSLGTVANTNPITLDGDGKASVYANAPIKFVLYEPDPSGICKETPSTTLIESRDNVNSVQYVDWYRNIAELSAATDNVVGKTYYTQGYTTPGDGGGAPYLIKTVADYGKTPDGYVDHWADAAHTIVAILLPAHGLNIKTCGAAGDNVHDDYPAISAAINYAVAKGISSIYFPSSIYLLLSGTINFDTGIYLQGLGFHGDGNTSVIRQTGAGLDCIDLSTTQVLRSSFIKDMSLISVSGHVLNVKYGISGFHLLNVDLETLSTGKSVLYSNLPTLGIYNSRFISGNWTVPVGSTVNPVDIVVSATNFNENLFESLVANNSTNERFIRITCTDTASYLTNNTFRNINFENCKGGGIEVYNQKSLKLDGLSFWDAGVYTKSLVYLGANSGYETIATTINRVSRNGDSRADATVFDIQVVGGEDTVYSQCFTPVNSGGLDSGSYDFGGKRFIQIGLLYGVTGNGNPGGITLDPANGASLQSAKIATKSQSIMSGGTLTIASGEITLTGYGRYEIDTESAAGSDDLDTITYGAVTDGYILHIRPYNEDHDIVIKNGTGNIILSGNADFTMILAYDNLTLMWVSAFGKWVEQSRMKFI